ncbi:MAG: penicillin-binding protein 2 [Candidatus Terrybacteria bacterium]|nr:penicillin-binding protein 2 [Candidatus Terrybacteria bacterium]
MKEGFKFRIRLIYLFIFLFGAVLTTRLFFIQVVKGNYYEDLANQQYVAPAGEYFDRGSIYFKEKNGQIFSAAVIKKGFQLAVNPKILENSEDAYQKLSEIIVLDKNDFFQRVKKKDDPYEIVARRLDNETAKKISDLKIKGVNVFLENWRHYPADNLASHILGFVGYKKDFLLGRYGLEQYYENILSRGEENNFINSFAEIFTDIKKSIINNPEKGDIVLTIEPTVQSLLEKTLEKTMEKYKSQLAGGIIIEPKTGKILAMAVKPDFNPNFYNEVKDLSIFINPLVENVFEMGSIMKPLTLAAGLDQEKITPQTTYENKGYVTINGKRIENYDIDKYLGKRTMQEVLNYSLNSGVIFAMQQMGKEKFQEYLINYGFTEKTNIDLSQETTGMLSNVIDSPREIEYATASFGQGIAVTPIAMTTALSSLANGGVLMKPYVVEEIKIKEGKDIKIEPQVKKQVLKKESAEEISQMLVEVFDKALMDGIYKIEHYSVAAKTGTAQVIKEGEKGYEEGEYIHTFFGYAPAFDAKFLTFLLLVKPQGVRYASHSLSEPFVNIVKFLLNYYKVAPDR